MVILCHAEWLISCLNREVMFRLWFGTRVVNSLGALIDETLRFSADRFGNVTYLRSVQLSISFHTFVFWDFSSSEKFMPTLEPVIFLFFVFPLHFKFPP